MSYRPSVLVVDDEPDIRELLEMTLERMEVTSHSAADLQQARALLASRPFDLCLTDMRLPDGNGIELVEHIQRRHPHIPAAVITAHGNMEAAISALKAGAFDFVSKPVDLQVLRNLVTTALRLSQRPESAQRGALDLLGDSPAMRKTRATIAKLARSQAPVYISGESGTGKELVARLIHEQGPRADKPFVPVNCGAIPEHLMESEFFGHKKGSFTGAVTDKPGLFQAAQGGTLFLDEVADLPLQMQVKLLRAIQEKAVRVGRRAEGAPHRLPHPQRHPQGPLGAGRAGSIPPGPVLSHQCHRDPRPEPARAHRGHPPAGRPCPRPPGRPVGRAVPGHRRRGPWRYCAATPFPATCGSWKTSWSAP